MDRKYFIKIAGLGLAGFSTDSFGLNVFKKKITERLTILHTNDWHSRIEPFPNDGSRNSDLGGASRRAGIIEDIRKSEKNVLLLDAGDIFQGTPYFNYFGGELEFKLMSEMGYDVATMGNHDFDGGMDGFEKAMKNANFDFVTSNYDFTGTVLENKTSKYKIIEKSGIRIGIISANIELKGLVPQKLYKNTKYYDPIESSNKYANLLKKEYNCCYVICLSHLGYKYKDDKVSDVVLASETENIDLIIGGHTHTFMNKPDIVKNKLGNDVIVTQAGWGGLMLGRLDVEFDAQKKAFWSRSEFINS